MSFIGNITQGAKALANNADEIAAALAKSGAKAVPDVVSPTVRKALGEGLLEVDDVTRAAMDAVQDVAPAATKGADDVVTRGTSEAFADNADSIGAKAATPAAKEGYVFGLGDMLRSRVTGYTALGAASLIGTEYATGGALSSGFAVTANGTAHWVADQLQDYDPALAENVRDMGIDAAMFVSDLSNTGRYAVVNMMATTLERNGKDAEGAALRVTSVVATPSFALKLGMADEGARFATFLSELESAGVSQERLEQFLVKNPNMVEMIQNYTQLDLYAEMPNLRATVQQAKLDVAVERNDATILNGRAVEGKASAFAAAATNAVDQAAEIGVNAAANLTFAAQLMRMLEPIVEWFKERVGPLASEIGDRLFEGLKDFIESVTGLELDGQQETHAMREPAMAPAAPAPAPAPMF